MMELYLILIIILLLFIIMKLNFFKKIYTNSINGISIISNGKTVDCNEKLSQLFEYESKKDFLLVHPLKLSPPFQPDGKFSYQKAEEMMSIAKQDGTCRFDWVFFTKNGQKKYIELDIVKIKGFFSFQDKYFILWRDIDKRIIVEKKLKKVNENLENIIEEKVKKSKKQEEMLFQQSKQAKIGEMLSMIAHQWRQPLTAISSSLIDMQIKIMLRKLNNNELIQYISNELNDIENFTQTLTNTVNDFKDFYKVSKKKENISIYIPIQKAYQIIDKVFKDANIQISIDCDTECKIKIFESEIIQVLLSILQNSKDNFIQRNIVKREIKVQVIETTEEVKIEICDNGKGIKKENLDKIFLPYFTTKDRKNGTGLGLYMSYKIIQEHHDGTIEVKNIDGGVCFIITLKRN